MLYCLGSLLPRKHLADKAPQRAVKRHVSTIAAHSPITAGSLSSRSPSPRDTVGSTALGGRYICFGYYAIEHTTHSCLLYLLAPTGALIVVMC